MSTTKKKGKKHFKIVVYPIYVAYNTYNLKSFCDVKTSVVVVSCHVHKQKLNKKNIMFNSHMCFSFISKWFFEIKS